MQAEVAAPPRRLIVALVYLSLLLDNVLLTVVVPILPDFLYHGERCSNIINASMTNCSSEGEEAEKVGFLLSSKALVQIVTNPLLGLVTLRVGYYLPLLIGTMALFLAALLFATGQSFLALLAARSLQGIASSSIGVSGLCVVAALHEDDAERSRVMGVVLGSIALGVLLGYPLGGFLYDFVGKVAPFLFIAILVAVDVVLQLLCMDLKPTPEAGVQTRGVRRLLGDPKVTVAAGAIFISTTAMAVLEPCLPLWLLSTLQPEKWQLGTVFLPDSLGYLLATNLCGALACRLGRARVALAAMFIVGASCILVSTAGSLMQLLVPHLGLGLGIGAVDAALVPLLARLAGQRYGSMYALQQTAVSLAYALGPIVGGELVKLIGFPWLMRSVGILNVLYCPLLLLLLIDTTRKEESQTLEGDHSGVGYDSRGTSEVLYHRFQDSD